MREKNLLILLNSFMYFTLLLSILCQNTLDFCITYTHTNTHTKTLLFLIEKLSPTPVASPVSTCGEGAEKPHLMNLVGGSKDAIGRCQSREGEELI